jgi:hypothetical protein
MNRTGRLTLVKITLPAAPIYTAICLKLPSWFHEAMEKNYESLPLERD